MKQSYDFQNKVKIMKLCANVLKGASQ